MDQPFIIPNVEVCIGDIPARYFFRNTKKLSLEITKAGIVCNGYAIQWDSIKDVELKYFNGNPYLQFKTDSKIQLDKTVNSATYGRQTVVSMFFENKFYYRKFAPWFGASEYITTEFVKTLEEHNLFSVEKLRSRISENMDDFFGHSLWNISFLALPLLLILFSLIILVVGFTQNAQIQLL